MIRTPRRTRNVIGPTPRKATLAGWPSAFGRLVMTTISATRWAPSSYNEQPWTFVVARRGEPAFDDLVACLNPSNQWASHAAAIALSVAKLVLERNGKANRHAFHDVGLAAGHLILAAEALGVCGCMIAGFDTTAARERFAVPEGFEPVALIAMGYPGDVDALPPTLRLREQVPRVRKPLSAFVFSGRWGLPASFLSPIEEDEDDEGAADW